MIGLFIGGAALSFAVFCICVAGIIMCLKK